MKKTIVIISVIIIIAGIYLALSSLDTGVLGGRHNVPAGSKAGFGTTTPYYNFVIAANATSTISSAADTTSTMLFIYSFTAGMGGQVILEDSDGAGCSAITTLNGVLDSSVVTCPIQ